MTQSAADRRTRTAYRVTLCAQRLTDEHGLDGFTMDELADAAEVSRRTLFNYFPGKIDAVLGEFPTLDGDLLDDFRGGGPHGDLVRDLRTLVIRMLDAEDVAREDLQRARRILLDNSRLLALAHARYRELSAAIVAQIEAREGTGFDTRRARVAVHLLAALFDATLDEFLDDDDRPFSELFDESLESVRSLLGA